VSKIFQENFDICLLIVTSEPGMRSRLYAMWGCRSNAQLCAYDVAVRRRRWLRQQLGRKPRTVRSVGPYTVLTIIFRSNLIL